jgi:predicted acetyltransferase
MSGNVEVKVAPREARPVIENLMQLYFHDFSDFFPMTEAGELGEDGRYGGYGPLASYWEDVSRYPFLIRRSGRLIGFALVNSLTHSGRRADWNMAEFFIVRGHRRSGAGASAAQALFAGHPGLWEVAVMATNTPAQAFWPRAIAGCPGVRDLERLDLAGSDWKGPVFRFHIWTGDAARTL